jgi:glycosyltransferase involved in cell wall biosynthesis
VLLELIRWLKRYVDWDIDVLVHGAGPLLPDFRELGPTTVWRDPAPILDMLFRHSNGRLHRFTENTFRKVLLPSRTYDLIYANTIAAAPTVMHLAARAKSVLWHIHELGYAMRLTLPEDTLNAALRLPTRIVAASQAVKSMLCEEFAVAQELVDVVHSFTPLKAALPDERRALREKIRIELQWPQNAFVVGGCGSLGWRKGTDLFAQIANIVRRTGGIRDIRFLWVGGHPGTRDWLELAHDLDVLRLAGKCSVVPVTGDVGAYYCAMDAFALTSREEPLGLVALEAAEYGLPIICFRAAGGAEEFVSDDAGIRVPYLDNDAFAEGIVRLCDDSVLRSRMGHVGRTRVNKLYRVDVQAPKLLRSIQQCLDQTAEIQHAAAVHSLGAMPTQQAPIDLDRSN